MNDGRKKKPQKHQNKTAFKIQFDTLALNMQKKVSLSLLCKRCSDQISWKLQFNKYKRITEPSKCNFCHQKNVVRSYMKCCDACAEAQTVCPKCLGKDLEIPEGDEVKLSQKEKTRKQKQEQKAMNDFVDSLKERSRRKVRREYEKGIITWDNEHKLFRDMEENQVVGLKFKSKGLDDLDKEMDDDSDIDEQIDDGDAEQNKLQPKVKQNKQEQPSQNQQEPEQDEQGSYEDLSGEQDSEQEKEQNEKQIIEQQTRKQEKQNFQQKKQAPQIKK